MEYETRSRSELRALEELRQLVETLAVGLLGAVGFTSQSAI